MENGSAWWHQAAIEMAKQAPAVLVMLVILLNQQNQLNHLLSICAT